MIYILRAVFVLSVLMATNGCGEKDMGLYKQSDISDIVVESSDSKHIDLRYLPLLETLHYSPGANLMESTDTIDLELVRCSINNKCVVTNQAKQTDSGSMALTVEHKGKSVWLIFKDGKLKVYPK